MSEFRQNFATKEWVIIAPERAKRPHDIAAETYPKPMLAESDPDCPFCPQNEKDTGSETLRYPGGSGWLVRSVVNKYAALHPESLTAREQHGLFLKADSYGCAEVIIESPLHNILIEQLPDGHMQLVLQAYLERARAIGSMPNMSIVMLFRNFGPKAGTSLEHPHSQIIGSPIIPPHIRDPFQKAALHYDSYGSCVYCDILREEMRQQERIIVQNDEFVALCPFASRSPFEIRIYPKRHAASFLWIQEQDILPLALLFQNVLRRLSKAIGSVDYNYVIRSSPIGDEDVRHLHWYFLLIPKISTSAGFEIGSGIYINASSPERCAEMLRKAG